MKKVLPIVFAIAFMIGCSTAQKTAFVGTQVIASTVSASLQSFKDYQDQNHIPNTDPVVQKVRNLDLEYLKTLNALETYEVNYITARGTNAPPSGDINLTAARDALSKSASDLVAFVSSVIPKK